MNTPSGWCLPVLAALVAVVAFSATPASAADRVLFDFENAFDASKVPVTNGTVAPAKRDGGTALAVTTGHKEPWPGVALAAPGGTWDLTAFEYIAVDVRNTGTSAVTVNCRVDNTGANGTENCCTDSVALKPGETGMIRVAFHRRPKGPEGIKLFGMRGYPVPQDSKGSIDPAKVTQLVIFVGRPTEDHTFEIDNVRAAGTYVAPKDSLIEPAKFFPLIDTFGQYIHREWPGKTHAVTDLADARAVEEANLKAKPGPKSWNEYGGWKDGPSLKTTGFFRTEKHQGKWWLVDPTGRLFWSHGIDCVNEWADTPTDDRDTWFQDFPGAKPEFKEFLGTSRPIMGYYKDRTVKTFNFAGANLKRKYAEDWKKKAADVTHRRLRSWGMNTIANWSDAAVYSMKKTPYTATVWFQSKPIQGSSGYWGQFKDPFEPEFAEKLRAAVAREKGKSAGDPWCIGYFVDNEISWGDDPSLAVAALGSPPEQAAKKAFIEDLKAKYAEIGKLNEAWGTSHASWDALASSTAAPDKTKAGADLSAFYTRIAEQYFKVCREAVKEVAPNQLYLGCRFAWVNDRAAAAGAKFCDVVSYNLYRRSVADFRIPGGADKPVVIGEFHFGALDRGMFHTGLVSTASQVGRAASYKSYVQGALRNTQIVGTHWFQYRDESTTGRPYDEENYQIGFVDICDTPYPETVAACREVGYEMYAIRGK